MCVIGCDKNSDAPSDPPPKVEPPPDPGPADVDDGTEPPPRPGADRTPLVPQSHPLYARLEGDGYPNACDADADCSQGGCSSEVCSAERGVITTCEAFQAPKWPEDAQCGCVATRCQWWSPSGATLPGGGAGGGGDDGGGAAEGGDGTCGGEACAKPKECISYYGIAGPNGPKFQSCEIRCKGAGKGTCPDGTKCVTIADGPGSVCR